MTGISVNSYLGFDYSKNPVSLLHLQPSINSPWTLTPSTGYSVTLSLK